MTTGPQTRTPSGARAAEAVRVSGVARQRLVELVSRFGLDVRDGVPVAQLAVGEQQRLEILRALDADAKVLLLDEPTAVLTGVETPDAGIVTLDGAPVPHGSPRRRIARRIAYIPSDRYRTALVRPMSLADNVELGRGAWWRSRRRSRRRAVAPRLAAWNVRAAGPGAPVRSLSGGNAQKLVLARELDQEPDLVVTCHPTRGLDPGAAAIVAERVLDAADDGAAVVWMGAELEEVLAVSE